MIKLVGAAILLLLISYTSFGQADFKDPYCFQHPGSTGSKGMALIDSMYPSHLFKTEEIKEYLQQNPETPYGHFYEFHLHNYYRPNEKLPSVQQLATDKDGF